MALPNRKNLSELTEGDLDCLTHDELFECALSLLRHSKILEKDVNGFRCDAERLRRERNDLREEVVEIKGSLEVAEANLDRLLKEVDEKKNELEDMKRANSKSTLLKDMGVSTPPMGTPLVAVENVSSPLLSQPNSVSASGGSIPMRAHKRLGLIPISPSSSSSDSDLASKSAKRRKMPKWDAADDTPYKPHLPPPSIIVKEGVPPPPPPPPDFGLPPTFNPFSVPPPLVPAPPLPPPLLGVPFAGGSTSSMSIASQSSNSNHSYHEPSSAYPQNLSTSGSGFMEYGYTSTNPTESTSAGSNGHHAPWHKHPESNSGSGGRDYRRSDQFDKDYGNPQQQSSGYGSWNNQNRNQQDTRKGGSASRWSGSGERQAYKPNGLKGPPLICGRMIAPANSRLLPRNEAMQMADSIRNLTKSIDNQQLIENTRYLKCFCKTCGVNDLMESAVVHHAFSREHLDAVYACNSGFTADDFNYWKDVLSKSQKHNVYSGGLEC